MNRGARADAHARFYQAYCWYLRPARGKEIGIQMLVYATIAQAFLTHLQRLPRSWGLT